MTKRGEGESGPEPRLGKEGTPDQLGSERARCWGRGTGKRDLQ